MATTAESDISLTAVRDGGTLQPLLTHLDASFRTRRPPTKDKATAADKPPPQTEGLLWMFPVTGNVSQQAARTCVARVVSNLAKLCSTLSSTQSVMENLGFGARIQTTKPRQPGQPSGSSPATRDMLVPELEKRYEIMRTSSAKRAEAALGVASTCFPYPLTEVQVREALRTAASDGRAPGVQHELSLGRGLSTDGNLKLSQLASVCVRFADPQPITNIIDLAEKDNSLLPDLVVNMNEFISVIQMAYEDSDKSRCATTSSIKPPAEALWWVLFCHPQSNAWSHDFNHTQTKGQSLTYNRSADEPTSPRTMAVAAMNALAQDPKQIVSALVQVLNRMGRNEYENTIVPTASCESEETLTHFLTQAAHDIASVSETCLTTCVTLRAGALSRPLQNYAGDSGASAGNSPNSFVSDVPGVQRSMELLILSALDVLAGGVQEGGAGRLWKVLLRVNPMTMCNPNPDGKPDEAQARPKRKPGGAGTPGSGGSGKKSRDADAETDAEEKADAETEKAIQAAAKQVAKSMPTDREILIERLAKAIARMEKLPGLTAEEDQRLSQLQERYSQADVNDLLGI
jgi:hypothetical protein